MPAQPAALLRRCWPLGPCEWGAVPGGVLPLLTGAGPKNPPGVRGACCSLASGSCASLLACCGVRARCVLFLFLLSSASFSPPFLCFRLSLPSSSRPQMEGSFLSFVRVAAGFLQQPRVVPHPINAKRETLPRHKRGGPVVPPGGLLHAQRSLAAACGCMRVCARACMRACVHACMCACVRACVLILRPSA